MSRPIVSSVPLPQFCLWEKTKGQRILTSFDLEITARCNNNCKHCYINLPAGDQPAKARELAFEEIQEIADRAVSLGALWCLITGGEPLLREDFPDLYLYLKRKGLLVSVFTNATLVTEEHIRLFQAYPPRDIEVTVYGATEVTYERVTRRPGSYAAFRRGLDLLLRSEIRVRLKAMALRSNLAELNEIAGFCRKRTADYYRFDPVLHLRFDGNPRRNQEIKAERLTPGEIAALERSDTERFQALQKECNRFIAPAPSHGTCSRLFSCGAGRHSFAVSYDGLFRLCSSLWHPDYVYDLRGGTLEDAWCEFVPQVLDLRSNRSEFLETCRSCTIKNLCMWCPAHAHLETGELDAPVDYFCQVAHARAVALRESQQRV